MARRRKHEFDVADVLRIARAIKHQPQRDADEYLSMVVKLHAESERMLADAVRACREMEPPLPWGAVGELLGYSPASAKQQAQRKYGKGE